MAYLKFSRDKRGYEHFCLVQPPNRGKGRPRVLYWFRTPPGIRVGRSPFDPDVRRALEAQNPDVAFDWKAITHTPIPPPVEAEQWRERRRLERVFRENEKLASTASASEPQAPAGEQQAPSGMMTGDGMMTGEMIEEPAALAIEELDPYAEPDTIEELPATAEPALAPNLNVHLGPTVSPTAPSPRTRSTTCASSSACSSTGRPRTTRRSTTTTTRR